MHKNSTSLLSSDTQGLRSDRHRILHPLVQVRPPARHHMISANRNHVILALYARSDPLVERAGMSPKLVEYARRWGEAVHLLDGRAGERVSRFSVERERQDVVALDDGDALELRAPLEEAGVGVEGRDGVFATLSRGKGEMTLDQPTNSKCS